MATDFPFPDFANKLELTGSQRTLHAALRARSPDLAVMYLGGLFVLADLENPDRFSLCAHSLRELMEKLPEHLNVPTKARGESLGSKVQELRPIWEQALKKSSCNRQGNWEGPIDNHLQTLLQRAASFFAWLRDHQPRRRDEAAAALRRMDATGRALPAPLETLNVAAWDKLREFFQSVAHHRKRVTSEEFLGWIEGLDRFLLERLAPRTFDDFDEIDSVIKDGDHA